MKNLKQKNIIEIIIGLLLTITGVILYLSKSILPLNVPRPELIPIIISAFGIILILQALAKLFLFKSKQEKILSYDERYLTINNYAKSNAFDVTILLLLAATFVLGILGVINIPATIIYCGIILIGEITHMFRLCFLQSKM